MGLTVIQNTPSGGVDRAVGLDGDREAAAWRKAMRKLGVELQERFAAGADDERSRVASRGRANGCVTAATRSSAVLNLPPPEPSVPTKLVSHQREQPPGPFSRSFSSPVQRLQPAESQEHGGTAGIRAFALQRVVDLFDGVGHGASDGQCGAQLAPGQDGAAAAGFEEVDAVDLRQLPPLPGP